MRLLVPIGLMFASLWSPNAAGQQAETLIRQGNIIDAIPAAEREALLRPDDLDAWERWIDLYQSIGMRDRVLPTLRTRIRQSPDNPNAHYLLGRALPDPAASRRAYEAALRLDPDHGRAWMGIGALERATGDLKTAADAYQRALRAEPNLAEAWGGLLAVFQAVGDLEGLTEAARAAVKAVPEDPAPWLALSGAVPEEAGQTLRTAVRHVGWDARVVAALAEQLLREDDASAARETAKRALALDARHRGAHFARWMAEERLAGTLSHDAVVALARLRTRPGVEALPPIAALLERHPRSPMLWIAQAASRPPDQAADALADLERALALQRTHPEARAALALRVLADDPTRAAELLRPVVQQRPEDPDLAAALARALLEIGRAEEALEVAQPGSERHPFHAPLALAHIHARSATGDPEGALQAARALAGRAPEPSHRLVWAAAARQAGRPSEAARVYRQLGQEIGEPRLAALAEALERGEADQPPSTSGGSSSEEDEGVR